MENSSDESSDKASQVNMGNPEIPEGTKDAALHASYFNSLGPDVHQRHGIKNNAIHKFLEIMQNQRGKSVGVTFQQTTSDDVRSYHQDNISGKDGISGIFAHGFTEGLLPSNPYAEVQQERIMAARARSGNTRATISQQQKKLVDIGFPAIPEGSQDAALHASYFNSLPPDVHHTHGAKNNEIHEFLEIMQNQRGKSVGVTFQQTTSEDVRSYHQDNISRTGGISGIFAHGFTEGLLPSNPYAEVQEERRSARAYNVRATNRQLQANAASTSQASHTEGSPPFNPQQKGKRKADAAELTQDLQKPQNQDERSDQFTITRSGRTSTPPPFSR